MENATVKSLKKKEDSILTCLVGLQYISKMKKKEMYFHLLIIIIIVVDYYYYYYYYYDFHLFIWGGHSSQYYASNDLSFCSETSACRTISQCDVFKI